jgi:hypothetical protein
VATVNGHDETLYEQWGKYDNPIPPEILEKYGLNAPTPGKWDKRRVNQLFD